MRRFLASVLLILWASCVMAVERSTTIVYVNGAKYYIHTVLPGETLYALSKAYQVGEKVIAENNPEIAQGLRAGANVRIPFVAAVTEQMSDKKLRKTFNIHTVTKGETLYAISRTFQIPIPTIVEDNPGIDPIHLRLGEQIRIRKAEVGSENEQGSKEHWEKYRSTLSSVAEKGFAYHIVQPGETFYSLSHRFGINELQLSELNSGLKAYELKAGAMLKVPATGEQVAATATPETVAPPQAQTPEGETAAGPQLPRIEFRPLHAGEPVNVALLLPMAVGSGDANGNYLEFYQGFLLALDSLKTNQGLSVNLTLFNTGRDPEKIREIIETREFRRSNLIVGPVYEEGLYPIVSYAEQHGIPVVSPLANITKMGSDVLFQLAPDPARKYEKAADLINGDRRVTLIYSGSTDKEYEQEIRSLLGDSKYERHEYRYEHPSRGGAGGPSDLTPLLDNGADNVFVVMADNEIDVDRILAAIASADTSLTGRGRTTPRFVVLGSARWNRYNNIDRTMFFKDRVIFVSTYHAKRDSEAVVAFDGAYIRNFGSLPTLYSYRGYDAAMIFIPAMYNDIQYDMEGRTYTPLQTSYAFGQDVDGGNHVNRNWTRVNYNSDFTITIE